MSYSLYSTAEKTFSACNNDRQKFVSENLAARKGRGCVQAGTCIETKQQESPWFIANWTSPLCIFEEHSTVQHSTGILAQ